jgi:quercetin dioxygenase-like cupin family protein
MPQAALALAAALLAAAAPAPAPAPLPDPLMAGWHGRKVCELLSERPEQRVLRCTFPPGVGHERHYHAPHWGYIIAGSTMRITSASGTVVRELKAGDSWWSDGVDWHEGLNVGQTTGQYLIVEPRNPRSVTMAVPARPALLTTALALPLAAAAQPAPPPPAAPPINLTAPAVGEKKVVIVESERHAGAGAGHTVTIQRTGRTYVFTTDRELTPAELEARIAKVDAEVAQLPPPPAGQPTVVIRRSDKPQR